jgi:hypothetical protein
MARLVRSDADLEFAVVMHSTVSQSSILSPHVGCPHLSGRGSVSELRAIRPRSVCDIFGGSHPRGPLEAFL